MDPERSGYATRLEREFDARLARLEKIMLGNGNAGLDERVRLVERDLSSLQSTLREVRGDLKLLASEREAVRNQVKGGRVVLTALVGALGALGIGGGIVVSRGFALLDTILKSLPP